MSKKLFVIPALLLAAFGVAFLASCKKDCKFDSGDYVGQFAVNEDCANSAPAAYTITITPGSTDTEIKIANFWDKFGAAVTATIDCETLTIARQNPDNDTFFVEGSGTIEKSGDITTLTLTYTVEDVDPADPGTDNCTSSVFTKL